MKHLGFIKSGKDIVIVEYLESVVSALSDGVAEDIKNASDELKRLISSIPKFEIKVVDALSTENISTSTVYLLRATKTTTQDIFEEYVYAKDGDTYKWERLGSQKIDFSNYYQKSETYNRTEVDALIKAVKDYFDNGVAKEAAKVSNALTIKKGSTTTTYDGSEQKSVEIPDLGETTGTAYEGSKGKANATNIATLLSYFVEGVAKAAAKLSHKITFKGGVVGTFDGSEDKEVTIPSALSDLTPDATHRTVTDDEKIAWNAKYDKPSGGIPNSDLAHSSMTIAGNNVALGGSIGADTIVGAASASAQFAGTADKAKNLSEEVPTIVDETFATKTLTEQNEVVEVQKLRGNSVEVDGQIVSFTAKSIVSRGGINLWDETWEVGGYRNADGVKYDTSDRIRSSGFIEVTPLTEYFIRSAGGEQCSIFFYREDKTMISRKATMTNVEFITPDETAYITFVFQPTYGTAYKNDICINISNANINGDYFAYESTECRIDVTKLRSKTVELIFPDGMASVGDVRDEFFGHTAIKRVGVVDLGEFAYTAASGDGRFRALFLPDMAKNRTNLLTADFAYTAALYTEMPDMTIGGTGGTESHFYIRDARAASLAADKFANYIRGRKLYYELASPIEYELDDALTIALPALQGSTLEVVGENTAPLNATMAYYKNARKVMRDLIGAMSNYMSRQRDEAVNGIKDFIHGIKVAGHAIWYDAANDTLMMDGNVAATGGLSSGGIQQARSTRGATGFVAEIDATANVPVSIENEVGTTNIVVSVYDRTNNAMVLADVVISPTQITVTTTQTKQLKVVVIGL